MLNMLCKFAVPKWETTLPKENWGKAQEKIT